MGSLLIFPIFLTIDRGQWTIKAGSKLKSLFHKITVPCAVNINKGRTAPIVNRKS